MKKIKRPKIGDYVLVSRWRDKSPYDPWRVGFVRCVTECENGITCNVNDDKRSWSHIWRISREEGEEWLRMYGNGAT